MMNSPVTSHGIEKSGYSDVAPHNRVHRPLSTQKCDTFWRVTEDILAKYDGGGADGDEAFTGKDLEQR